MELGILAGAAVGIVGDFLAGVVQNMAAGALTDLVRQRLRSTDDGRRALEGLEGAPQDSGRRMEAAGVLAGAAQGDSSFAQALSDAVDSYHRDTNQGTATSGSPHHQVNISGGGISGKGHQVAGGDIDNSKKRNVRIGIGAFAVLVVGLGGYGITQWVGDSRSESGTSSVAGAAGGLSSDGTSEPEAPASKTLSYDLQRRIQGDDFTHRSRGSLVITPRTPMSSHPACQLNAPSGTSIVPVTLQLTNTNSPEWEHESGNEYEAETVTVTTEAPKGISAYLHVPEVGPAAEGLRRGACINGGSLASRYEPGGSRTVDLLLWGVPQGKKTEIALKVDASNFEGHKVFKFTVRG